MISIKERRDGIIVLLAGIMISLILINSSAQIILSYNLEIAHGQNISIEEVYVL